MEEVTEAMKGMKRGKAKDGAGVVAEMLKDSSDLFVEYMVLLFNDVLCLRKGVPAAWRKTKLTVVFKKGDRQQVGNYRPIAIISVLYKVFSRVVCKRLLDFIIPGRVSSKLLTERGTVQRTTCSR